MAKAKGKKGKAAEDEAQAHRDDEDMSYLEIAESRPEKAVVITGRAITPLPQEPPKRHVKGDFVVQTTHIWAPLPDPEPPKHPDDKPSRVTTVVKSEVLSPKRAYKKPPPSIGSMQPPGKG